VSHELASIDTERRDGRLILCLRGDIDLSNAQTLQQRIEHAVVGNTDVVLDLSAIGYIDSQGLRLLSQLSKRLSREGSKLQLIAPPGSFARRVLGLTRMSEDIEVVDTIDSATGPPTRVAQTRLKSRASRKSPSLGRRPRTRRCGVRNAALRDPDGHISVFSADISED
jgi:anti-anti-sigma factor